MLELRGKLEAQKLWTIGVVTSRFNRDVTQKLRGGCLARLEELGFAAGQVVDVSVPGAYEIPLAARELIESGADGVIALGAVIRGDTSHYDYVCSAVERGCSLLQHDYGKPVVFGVLTTETEEQAFDRIGGSHGHKGIEAADVLVEMLNLLNQIRNIKETNNDTIN